MWLRSYDYYLYITIKIKLSKRIWANGADKGIYLSISSKNLYILDNLKLAISYWVYGYIFSDPTVSAKALKSAKISKNHYKDSRLFTSYDFTTNVKIDMN